MDDMLALRDNVRGSPTTIFDPNRLDIHIFSKPVFSAGL